MLDIKFIIVISIFLILITLIFASTFFKKNSRLDIFVNRLPIVSHFFVGFGILITFLLFISNYQESVVKETVSTINETFLHIFDILELHKDRCPNLANSFFFKWQLDGKKISSSSLQEDDPFSVMYVSNNLFQIVGLYVQRSSNLSVTSSRFLSFFSSFFKSHILKKEWPKYKANFGIRSYMLINKLFEVNEQYTFKNSTELRNFWDDYVKSDEFLNIIQLDDSQNTINLL